MSEELNPCICGTTSLPKITDEMVDDFAGTQLIEMEVDGPNWSQIAVDFACILNVNCHMPKGYKLVPDNCPCYLLPVKPPYPSHK